MLDESKDFRKIFAIIAQSLVISSIFTPYQNLISEYYYFINYFPGEKVRDLFEKKLLISGTDLKNIILDKKMVLFLEAIYLYEVGKYSEAIAKYIDILKIDKTNEEAQKSLADCYLKKHEFSKAISICLELEKKEESNVDKKILFKIALCYAGLMEHAKSIQYFKKAEKINKITDFHFLLVMTYQYSQLNDSMNTKVYYLEAESSISNEDDMQHMSDFYTTVNRNDDALRLINKALMTKPNNPKYLLTLGQIYMDLFEWKLAVAALEKANRFNKKDFEIQVNLGCSLLFSKKDIYKSKLLFEHILKSNNNYKAIANGNLGHYYLLNGEKETALKKYENCILLLKDESSFCKKMDYDLKFITKLGITEQEYNFMKNRVVEHYLSLKKYLNKMNGKQPPDNIYP